MTPVWLVIVLATVLSAAKPMARKSQAQINAEGEVKRFTMNVSVDTSTAVVTNVGALVDKVAQANKIVESGSGIDTLVGSDAILQYWSGDFDEWKVKPKSWGVLALHCAVQKCVHVVVTGHCGFSRKMCKRLALQAIAQRTGARTVFVDSDIVPLHPRTPAFSELCGSEPFSVGCRFNDSDIVGAKPWQDGQDWRDKSTLQYKQQHSTDSGILCIDASRVDNESWVELDVIARCHNRSKVDQRPFYKLYRGLHDSPKMLLHCLDESKYGAFVSSQWKHFWGHKHVGLDGALQEVSRSERGTDGSIEPQTLWLQLKPFTLTIGNATRISWRMTDTGFEESRRTVVDVDPQAAQLLSDGLPSAEVVKEHAQLLSDDPKDLTEGVCAEAAAGVQHNDAA